MLSIIDTEFISRIIGEKSGAWGILLASVLGSVTLIPGFIAFSTAAMLLFEMTALGFKFALLRLALNIPIIMITAYIMEILIKKDEVAAIYKKAEDL